MKNNYLKYFIIIVIFTSVFSLLFVYFFVFASFTDFINPGETVVVDFTSSGGDCKEVTNNTSDTHFFPARDIDEWNVNKVNSPSGLALEDCGIPHIFIKTDTAVLSAWDKDGNQRWSITFDTDFGEVEYRDGYVYTVTKVESDGDGGDVKKINASNGSIVWSRNVYQGYLSSGGGGGMAVDSYGNVYSGDVNNVGSVKYQVVKLNSSGVEQWRYSGNTSRIYGLDVDNCGNVYSGDHNDVLIKINWAGVEQWKSYVHSGDVECVVVDKSGYIITGSEDNKVRRINPDDGSVEWVSTSFAGDVYSCAVDSYNNAYGNVLTKYNINDGSVIWNWGNGYGSQTTLIDDDGYIYLSQYNHTPPGLDPKVTKLDSNRNVIWQKSIVNRTGSIAVVKSEKNSYGSNYDFYNGWVLKKVNSNLQTIWTNDPPDHNFRVVADKNGYTYTVDADNNNMRKINPDGTKAWEKDLGSKSRAIAVDFNGNVYTGSANSDVRKFSPNGGLIWTYPGHSSRVDFVSVDKNGYVYSSGVDRTLRKINPSGNLVWSFTGHTDDVIGNAVDQNGYVYTCSEDDTVRKISPTGVEQWSFTGYTSNVEGVAVDANGYVYSTSPDGTAKKISPSGSQVWSYNIGCKAWFVAVDPDGYVYAGTDCGLWILTPTGTLAAQYGCGWRAPIVTEPGLVGAGFWE